MNDKAESAGAGIREVIDFLRGAPGVIGRPDFEVFDHDELVAAVRAAVERRFAGTVRIANQDETAGLDADLVVADERSGESAAIDVVLGADAPERLRRRIAERRDAPGSPARVLLVGGNFEWTQARELEALRDEASAWPQAAVAFVLPDELWNVVADFAPESAAPPTLRPRMLSDRPLDDARADRLAFAPIAKAFADLIDLKETDTPLTVAVNAPWGAGKTSLANLIIAQLAEKPADGGTRPHLVFWFDAWMHDEAQNLSLAFLGALARFLDARRPFLSRLLRPLPHELLTSRRRRFRRIRWLTGILAACAALALAVFAWQPGLVGEAIKGVDPKSLGVPGAAAAIALGAYAIHLLRHAIEFGGKIGDFVADPKGESTHGGLERLREQLRDLVRRATPPGSRLVIFIDDLERCRPPGAVNLLETVNQHLAFEGVVVVVLADMSAVGASALSKYEALAKHYAPAESGTHGAGEIGAFGRIYLQKMIQLQFTLPEPRPEQIEGLLDRLIEPAPDPATAEESLTAGARWLAAFKRLSFVTAAWRGDDAWRFAERWRNLVAIGEAPHSVMGNLRGVARIYCAAAGWFQVPPLLASRWAVAQAFADRPTSLRERVPPLWVHLAAYGLYAIAVAFGCAAIVLIAALLDGLTAPTALTGANGSLVEALLAAIVLYAVFCGFSAMPSQVDAAQTLRRYTGTVAALRKGAGDRARKLAPDFAAIGAALDAERRTRNFVVDSPALQAARREAMRHLRQRPRSAKRLINLLRLTMLILGDRAGLGREGLTPETVGRWVAMQELWPDLAAHVKREPGWIRALEDAVADAGTLHPDVALEKLVHAVAPQFADFARLQNFVADSRLSPVIDRLVYMTRHQVAAAAAVVADDSPAGRRRAAAARLFARE